MSSLEETLNKLENMLPRLNWGVNKDTNAIVICSDIACTQCKFFGANKNYIPCRFEREKYLEELK